MYRAYANIDGLTGEFHKILNVLPICSHLWNNLGSIKSKDRTFRIEYDSLCHETPQGIKVLTSAALVLILNCRFNFFEF